MDRAGAWIYFLRSSWVWGKRIPSSRNFEYVYRNRWDFSLRIAWSYKEFLLFYLYSPLTPCPIQMSKILLNSDKRAANLNVKKKIILIAYNEVDSRLKTWPSGIITEIMYFSRDTEFTPFFLSFCLHIYFQ